VLICNGGKCGMNDPTAFPCVSLSHLADRNCYGVLPLLLGDCLKNPRPASSSMKRLSEAAVCA
jgi:hypothetical protein